MKQKIIISLIVFCLSSVNVFAINNFLNEQKNHGEFYSIFSHEHTHLHHGMQHSHGHVHKINLVDFQTNQIQTVIVSQIKNDKPPFLKLCFIDFHPIQLFRPPIS